MRLIDAEALKKEVKTLFCPDGYKIMMLERIENAPTVFSSGDIIDFEGRVVGHINLEDVKEGDKK